MSASLPKAFLWRRLHSFLGLWLFLFLIEHLLTNSQAALWVEDYGGGFIRGVNLIYSLPYLHAIELFLLGVPFLVHIVLGVKYLFTAKYNSMKSDGKSPSLSEYGRNRAYTWQRITAWLLIAGLFAHVLQMRFLDYPAHARIEDRDAYVVRVGLDEGLYTVADRLGVALYDSARVKKEKARLQENATKIDFWNRVLRFDDNEPYDSAKAKRLIDQESARQGREWVAALEKRPLREGEVLIVSDEFSKAALLTVRDTFKSPLMMGLYFLFVLAAVFHACNGLWTLFITWGVILPRSSQKLVLRLCLFLMIALATLGLAAVGGTYWISLRY